MDRQAFLNIDELRAGLELIRRFSDSYPVDVAFWINYLNDDRFFLCIASSAVSPTNYNGAAEVAFRLAMEHGNLQLDPMAINLVGMDEPITQRAIDLRQGYVGISRSSSNKVFYRGTPVETIYVYSERHLQLGVLN